MEKDEFYMAVTLLTVLEESLAKQGRRVISDWRAALIIWKATQQLPPGNRRWQDAPDSAQEARPLLDRLARKGNLKAIIKSAHLYQVTSPFANVAPIQEYEVLMEANPYCAISHHSAMAFHQLTLDFPNEIQVSVLKARGGLLPIETTEADWDFLALPVGRRIPRIFNTNIRWHAVKSFAGIREARPSGYTIRVTNLERTLLDGLQDPDWCGGFDNVLSAWRMAKDLVNVNMLVKVADELNINLLRQRAGFILERMGIDHPRLKEWQALAKRGGSSRLVAKTPFASTYDQNWSLSINAPLRSLDENVQ